MATLQRLGDEAKCLLDQTQLRIGRSPENEIILEDEAVSGHHALITIRPLEHNEKLNEYIIEDLNKHGHSTILGRIMEEKSKNTCNCEEKHPEHR